MKQTEIPAVEEDWEELSAADEHDKLPFDIDAVMRAVAEAVRPYPKAALFELEERGYGSAFEQLVACIISIRTRDEVTLPVSECLFAVARNPREMAKLTVAEIDHLIRLCSFHEAKAHQIREIAVRVENEFGGDLPCDFETLTSFRGVGPKCANLVLGIACGEAEIGVDIHVHRVTNRWGYVREPTPEKTRLKLETVLPKQYWVAINRLLVPFGKHVCTGRAPRCSTCPVLPMCRQVGVIEHR